VNCSNAKLPLVAPAPAIPRQRIARSFGRAAHTYDTHAALQRTVADHLLAQDCGQPAAILDLGSGTGYCATLLHARHPNALLCALDLALPMLQATAQRGIGALGLICADAERLPFLDRSFNLVVSSLTVQWCTDLERLFAGLFRVLDHGGRALLSTFGPATLAEVRAAWAAVDGKVHVNTFETLEVLIATAKAAGFVCTARSEPHVRHYPSLRAVATELKGIGARNMNPGRGRGLVARDTFARVEQAFAAAREPAGIAVTWEILYLDLSKP